MALQIDFMDRTGQEYPLSYHRVVMVFADYLVSHAQVTLYTYKDATARQAGKAPVTARDYHVHNPIFTAVFGVNVLSQAGSNPVAAVYTYLKTLPDFTGALDV